MLSLSKRHNFLCDALPDNIVYKSRLQCLKLRLPLLKDLRVLLDNVGGNELVAATVD